MVAAAKNSKVARDRRAYRPRHRVVDVGTSPGAEGRATTSREPAGDISDAHRLVECGGRSVALIRSRLRRHVQRR
jgi:hypothetical protein